jgi:hypothetical protein
MRDSLPVYLDFLKIPKRRIAYIAFPAKSKPVLRLKNGSIDDTFGFFLQFVTLRNHDFNIFRNCNHVDHSFQLVPI